VKKNVLEWVVFGVSALLIASLVGVLVMELVTSRREPPRVIVRLGKAVRVADHYRVSILARNEGDQTVEGVVVEATMTPSVGQPETAHFEIDFLPRRSEREGWVTFTGDPGRAKELKVRAIGYERP